jgi:hypothetical protein
MFLKQEVSVVTLGVTLVTYHCVSHSDPSDLSLCISLFNVRAFSKYNWSTDSNLNSLFKDVCHLRKRCL